MTDSWMRLTQCQTSMPSSSGRRALSNVAGSTGASARLPYGTVFALSLDRIELNIRTSGRGVVLIWDNTAFSLQAAAEATGVFTNCLVPPAHTPTTSPACKCSSDFKPIDSCVHECGYNCHMDAPCPPTATPFRQKLTCRLVTDQVIGRFSTPTFGQTQARS